MTETMFNLVMLGAALLPMLLVLTIGGIICEIIEKLEERNPWKRLKR